MGSLINYITALSAAMYGVNILEQSPPGGVKGVGTNVVAVVAHLPWGPVDTPTEVSGNAELFSSFAPVEFDVLDDWVALKAFINKTFPNTIKIVRISPTGAAAATYTFNDDAGTPAPSVDVTANYAGSVGNQIKVAWTVNADDATAMDATVSIGTTYSKTYKQVATIVSSALVITDPGDPFVTFAAHTGATLVPAAIAATSLATGADGTPAAGDYTTSLTTLADPSVEFSVGFVADPGASLIDDVNAAIKTFVDTYSRGFWVLCTPAGLTPSTAEAYAADYRTDRITMAAPRVKTIDAFDPNRDEVTVDGNAFAAVAIASVAPENSPGGAGGAQFLRGITGLEDGWSASAAQLKAMNDAGVTPWFMSTALGGAILHRAVTTSLTSGLTKVFRRRMTDFLVQSSADYLEAFVERPLDINLTKRQLGSVTGPEMGGLRAFFAGLLKDERISAYAIDEFGGNVQSNIDAGQWIILLSTKLISMQEEIVLKATIGESVQIVEQT